MVLIYLTLWAQLSHEDTTLCRVLGIEFLLVSQVCTTIPFPAIVPGAFGGAITGTPTSRPSPVCIANPAVSELQTTPLWRRESDYVSNLRSLSPLFLYTWTVELRLMNPIIRHIYYVRGLERVARIWI